MADKSPLSDKDLRLECARLVMAFGSKDDPVEAAERLFRYIRDGEES
jgi:hypothetical protein